MLRAAEEIQAKLKTERDEAEKKKNELAATLDLKKKEADAARVSALTDPTKQDEANAKELARQAAQKDHELAQQAFERARDSFLRQQETTTHIKALRDSSVNATNAGVSGGGLAGSIVVHGPKQADTQYFAATVDEMIRRYLHKDYFADRLHRHPASDKRGRRHQKIGVRPGQPQRARGRHQQGLPSAPCMDA